MGTATAPAERMIAFGFEPIEKEASTIRDEINLPLIVHPPGPGAASFGKPHGSGRATGDTPSWSVLQADPPLQSPEGGDTQCRRRADCRRSREWITRCLIPRNHER